MKTLRALTLALLAIELIIFASWTPLAAQSRPRAIIVSLDGAPAQQIQDLLRAGKLPNLARLIAGGAFADSVITVFPSKTAPAFASLWTGADTRATQISGNLVPRTPRNAHTILESTSGFFSGVLAAEPLWMSAARSGYKSVVLQATQAWPFERYINGLAHPEEKKQLVLFEGYAGYVGGNGVLSGRLTKPQPATSWQNLPPSVAKPLEIVFTVGSATLHGLFIDDPAEPNKGYDTLLLAEAKDGRRIKATLKPAAPGNLEHWSETIELPAMAGAAARFRLFELRSDGSDYLLYFTHPVREEGTRPELLSELRKAAGVFVGHGASLPYVRGLLGRPLFRGGDGTAERRYVETVQLNQRRLMDSTGWAMQSLPWDLLFTYTNYPDEAEHLWRGFLEPSLPGFRRDIAERLRPFLEQVYAGCDALLGEVMRLRPENAVIAVVSDHGIEGVNRAVRINVALERAGLLAFDSKRRVDLSKTKALYPPADNSYVMINTTDRKGGIVPPEERAQVVARISSALKQITDAGKQVLTSVYDAEIEGAKMGIGGPAGGDVYLDLAPGYAFDPRLGKGSVVVAREPYGMHGFNPVRPSMRTIMALHGPGVAEGRKLAEARTVDFAPTLARLLGIALPRDASGQVLQEALAP